MIRNWFKSGMRFRTFLILLPVLVLFCMGIARGGTRAVEYFAPQVEHSTRKTSYRAALQTGGILQMAPRSFFWVPLREETKYRLAPFGAVWIAWILICGVRPPLYVAFALVAGTSAYFGYIHGGVGNIFIQGAVGLVLALVLLKVSAYGSQPLKGALAAMILHGTYNFGIALRILIFS